MSRQYRLLLTLLLIELTVLTGCHPTQPFYAHEDGDLSHYVGQQTQIEYPDVHAASLADAYESLEPHTLTTPEFKEYWDLTLEQVVHIALHNSKVIRNLGSLTQFTIADGLVGRTAVTATVYDPAIFESDPQFGVEAALAQFDAEFTTSVFWQKTDRPQNVTADIGFIPLLLQQDLGQLDASLRKRTAVGTTFEVRHQTIYDNNNRGFGRALPSDWFTQFEVEATQPLLRNRGTAVNRVPVVLARLRTDISLADFEIAVRNMLLDIENAYWDLHFAYRSVETAKAGRDAALGTWQIVKEKARIRAEGGTVQEEAQAREQYYFFRSQLETALRDVYNFETRLRWLMGIAPTDHRLIRPIQEPSVAPVEFAWRESLVEAQFRSPELRRQRWIIKQRETELIAARNQLAPQLDMVLTYRWLGFGDDLIEGSRRGLNFVAPGSLAFDELTEGDYQESRLALQFTPPRIGARQELAGIQNARLNLAREHARLEDMELNVTHVLTTAVQNLDFNYRVARTHFNRWVAAEQEVRAYQTRREAGQDPLDVVLESQRRRAQAQIDFFRAVIDYNKSIADVHFRKGSLIEYNDINLAEGPWPKKAYWDALERARERDASYYREHGSTSPGVISRGPMDHGMPAGGFGAPLPGETIVPGEIIPPGRPGVPSEEELPLPQRLDEAMGSEAVRPAALMEETALDRGQMHLPDHYEWGPLGLGDPHQVIHASRSSWEEAAAPDNRLR